MIRITNEAHEATDMELLWKEDKLATFTGESVKTLRNRRVKGDGVPFVKLGRAVRYRPADVRAYVAAKLQQSTSETLSERFTHASKNKGVE